MSQNEIRKKCVNQAISILRGVSVSQVLSEETEELRIKGKPDRDANLLLALAKKLKDFKEFGFARYILTVALDAVGAGAIRLKIYQEKAVCTYKDSDLPTERRLREAFKLLQEAEDLATSTKQETLGIAGAIHKRLWQFDNQKQNLEDAYRFYHRGREQGVVQDQGYTAINEAYLLDLLASMEVKEAERAKRDAPEARRMREEARKIRLEIIEKVLPLANTADGEWLKREWWYYSTIGEAYFGLRRYGEAVHWLLHAKPADMYVPDWEYESTAHQLASHAHIQYGAEMPDDEFAKTGAGWALRKFFGNDNVEAVRSAFVGKIGLALSGGGFRASLFHIGVLARLAELDLLRRVEILSCVSGGSIVGAHYYLQVRHLLETKPDHEIKKKDYIEIVQQLEKDFLAGVQRNVRTRVAASLLTNLKMIFKPHYSRTLHAGELYESEIFSSITYRSPEEEKGDKRWINDLRIRPMLADGRRQDEFNPKSHNWKRGAKAPILILNATTLNTGHSWHFTVTYMGEPPGSINPEIDGNYRLRRMYYGDAPLQPTNHQKVRLGHAVAASACVPGLFEPLALNDLYEDAQVKINGVSKRRPSEELRVRLVDGGVCDNQGVMALAEQECSVMLVSDASGQMEAEATPGSGLLSVPLRSSSILQARVRESQYRDLHERRRSGLLRGLMFVHLKQDLGVRPLNWRNCPTHREVSDFDPSKSHSGDITNYDVAKDVQRSLAAIRTDLDSFCDVEADALMASAYLMTRHQLNEKDRNKDDGERVPIEGIRLKGTEENWGFRRIETYLRPMEGVEGGDKEGTAREKRKQDLKNIIGASGSLAFKIWKLSPALKVLSWVFVIVFLLVLIWGAARLFGISLAALRSVYYWVRILPTWISTLAVVAATILLIGINYIGKRWLGVVRWSDTLTSIAFGVVMTFFGFIAAWIHLKVFDQIYLRWGKRDRFYGGITPPQTSEPEQL